MIAIKIKKNYSDCMALGNLAVNSQLIFNIFLSGGKRE